MSQQNPDPTNLIPFETNGKPGAPLIKFSPGTSIFSGLFKEEFLPILQGQKAADVYDKMRRSDGQVSMVLSAITNTIRSANFMIEAGEQDIDEPFYEAAQLQAEFISFSIFEDLAKPWSDLLDEILTALPFGFAPFVLIDKNIEGHPKWGRYTGLYDLCYISQKSVYRWDLDSYGRLLGIQQMISGDLHSIETIPADFLVVLSIQKEGANYEGVSVLRSAYGSWWRKNQYLKIQAIGTERGALGIPTMTVPTGKEDSVERTKAEAMMQALAAHQLQWLIVPEGWNFNLYEVKYQADALARVIDQEDQAMARAALANFLNLGQSGSGGSYNLGEGQKKLFLSGNEYIAKKICDMFNTFIIPRSVRMQFGPQTAYPKMKVSGLTDKADKEWADMMVAFKSSGSFGVWSTDDAAHLRKRVGWIDENPSDPASGQPQPMNTPGSPGYPPPLPQPSGSDSDPADPAPIDAQKFSHKFAARGSAAQKLIGTGSEELADLMRANVRFMANKLVTDLVDAWERLPDGQKPNAIKKVQAQGLVQYKGQLRNALYSVATRALNQVKNENPKINPVGFSEKFADIPPIKPPKKSEIMKLPKRVREAIEANSGLIVDAQAADVEKAIFFQFGNTEPTTDSAAMITQELTKKIDGLLTASSAAAGLTAAKTVNETRHFFFFDEDVYKQIESFTFTNEDPVTEICTYLNGRVFRKDDAESWMYEPPLHYNCKSILVANEDGSDAFKDAKKSEQGIVPPKSLQDQVQLSCGCVGAHALGDSGISFDLDKIFRVRWFDLCLSAARTHVVQDGEEDKFDPKTLRRIQVDKNTWSLVGTLKENGNG